MNTSIANFAPKVERTLKKFGLMIKKTREGLNLTSKEVARKAGINFRTFSCIERGDPSISIEDYLLVMDLLDLTAKAEAMVEGKRLFRPYNDTSKIMEATPLDMDWK